MHPMAFFIHEKKIRQEINMQTVQKIFVLHCNGLFRLEIFVGGELT